MPTQYCTCGAKYRFPEFALGRRAKCKRCGVVFKLTGEEDDGTIPIADEGFMEDLAAAAGRTATAPAVSAPTKAPAPEKGPVCPSCDAVLSPKAKICIDCGIDIKTGSSILTARETGLDEIYVAAENVISWISWLFWFGIYPIASEAFGTRKPYATRAIAALTVVISVWFLAYELSDSPRMRTMKNLMLWAGDGDPSSEDLYVFYGFTGFGDSEAFYGKCMELREANPALGETEVMLAAHKALPVEKQYQGQFRPSQLITHAFLHGGVIHIAGNLLFLFVFGSRINAIIGSVATAALYPVLAVGAALAHMASMAGQTPTPMIGASGAIMGLAGVYFVLFPIHNVHMAAWWRWGLVGGFQLSLKMWSTRGFWVVLFYIAFDVVMTASGVDAGVARWAHLGGFAVGVGIGLVLLFFRLVDARGCDIVSAMLGKHAWALVGRPNRGAGLLQRLP